MNPESEPGDGTHVAVEALLRPRSVAVIGASERLGNGRNAVQNLLEIGFRGEIFPVNPQYERVLGLACYPSLAALPHVPDAIYVAVGANRAVAAIEEAGARGVRAAVVHAGGFAEIGGGGTALQAELTGAALANNIAVCGPNCLGLINVHDRVMLYGASMPKDLIPGSIGAVFQSGSTLLALMNAGRDLHFSYLVSSGNEAVLDCADYFDVLVNDPRTKVIIGFIDGFRQPQRFVNVAQRALAIGKPIILLKPGRSEAGRKAALAHTGALAGSDQVLEAVFRRYGVIRAHDLDELTEFAALFSGERRPLSRGGIIVTCVSGGEMAVVLDAAADEGVKFPELAPVTASALRQTLPSHIAVANPLDITATGLYEPDLYRDALVKLAADPSCGVLAISQDFPGAMGTVQAERYCTAARAFVSAANAVDKPVVVFSNLSGETDREVRSILAEGRVPFLLGTRESVKAINRFMRFGAAESAAIGKAQLAKSAIAIDADSLTKARKTLREAGGPLSEQESKAIVASFGLRVPREMVVTSAGEASAAAERLGYPVVLKIASSDIPHKTEAGGVRAGLTTSEAVAAAWTEIMASARAFAPDARIAGVSVQEQIIGGTELILGGVRDAQFGPVILLGFGGILVEVLRDTVLDLSPVGHSQASEMVNSLRGAALLKGARGRPPADVSALTEALVRVSHMAAALGEDLQELDINPLILLPQGQGVVAADVLVIPRGPRARRPIR